MLTHRRRPMIQEELQRLDEHERATWIDRWFFKKALRERVPAERVTDEYDVAVDRCVVPVNQNEAVPVYFLDLGGKILTLGGQTFQDFVVMPDEHFEKWAETEGDTFFASRFTLCGHAGLGLVFSIAVSEPRLMRAQPSQVPLQFNRLRQFEIFDGSPETLIHDLQRVGLAEPE